MSERTLFFVKPEAYIMGDSIYRDLNKGLHKMYPKQDDFRNTHPALVTPTRELFEAHYASARERIPPFAWDDMIQRFTEGQLSMSVYAGPDIVKNVKLIVGATDPAKAEKGTLRQKFGTDSLERSLGENEVC